jgi:hypothetical protein
MKCLLCAFVAAALCCCGCQTNKTHEGSAKPAACTDAKACADGQAKACCTAQAAQKECCAEKAAKAK